MDNNNDIFFQARLKYTLALASLLAVLAYTHFFNGPPPDNYFYGGGVPKLPPGNNNQEGGGQRLNVNDLSTAFNTEFQKKVQEAYADLQNAHAALKPLCDSRGVECPVLPDLPQMGGKRRRNSSRKSRKSRKNRK